ncbi:hypothetical protein [Xanthomarina sp. F2636L]|uniref:hypothetical protein n=1 Tax=Xanthomarina sp. F2636L TaxID=2996018 RepID=UPI00225E1413|nr:hypothetical protein [Xanthomarina sp. F2636L]MCX7549826.1 hypothetical protein [Xanthomarina sp. F2636L]
MREFLYEYYTLLNKSVEILAFLVGIIVYKKYKNTQVKYFIWFLGWIVFVETIGNYPRHLKDYGLEYLIEDTLIERNYWWYTLFWTSAATLFYSWFFSLRYKSLTFKKTIKVCQYIYLLILLTSIIFDPHEFFSNRVEYLSILSVFIILLSLVFYFVELINSEKLTNISKSIYFYISVTLFVWWLVTTPLSFFEKYFIEADRDFVLIKWYIMLISNVLMYSTFAFALVWCKPEHER